MDELAVLRSFRADAAAPPAGLTARERERVFARRRARRPVLVAAVAAACVLGGAGALAATGVLGGDLLAGPSAPPENDTALRNLFPPFHIGHATQLAEYDGRTLFGARTAKGVYCFSATSPIDPKGEGGHCVSRDASKALDAGRSAAFLMSGWSVGGFAPGASDVRLTGMGVDETVPVGANGWWLGIAEVPSFPSRLPPDQLKVREGDVIATRIDADGNELGSDPAIHVRIVRFGDGRLAGIGLMSGS